MRNAAENEERGKRLAGVIGILGALNIPLIHVSVTWFRSLHPEAVVLRPDGPQLPSDMLTTLMTGFLAFTLLFVAILLVRYDVEDRSRRARITTTPSMEPTVGGAV